MKKLISGLLVVAMLTATMLIALPLSVAADDFVPTGTVEKTADFYTLGTTKAANFASGGFKDTALFFKVTPGEKYKIYINKLTTIFKQKNDFASWTTPDALAQGKFANLTDYALDATSGCASPRLIVYSSTDGVLGSAISGFENMALQHDAKYTYFTAERSYQAMWWERRAGEIGYTSFTINFTAPAGVNEIGLVIAAGDYLSAVLNDPSDSLTLKVESMYVAQDFDEVSVDLGEDIALNYYAAAEAGDKVEFTVGDKKMTVNGVAEGTQNKFTLHLAPDQIAENVEAFLYNGNAVTKIRYTYSVKQYLNEMKTNYPADTALCALADAILAYGTAAKDYVDQNTEAAALTNNIPTISDYALNGNGSAVTFTSGNVFFDDTNDLIFAYKDAKNGVEWKVNDSAAGFVQANGTVTVESLKPTDFDTVYTVKATAGTDVTTASYSVNAYCFAIANKAGASVYAKNLAIATYNYGVAAEAYINK